MPVSNKTFDSVGGFSIDKTTIVDNEKNAKDLNTLQIKNSFYSDSNTTHYILRGINTSILSTDDVNSVIPLDNATINFIEASIVGVNDDSSVVLSTKLETAIKVSTLGVLSELSTMTTTVSDNVPVGQTWTVDPFLGAGNNAFSYNTSRSGTTKSIKWIAYVKVVSIQF
tara:strand:- start:280 stop:786 length:507 start_codon:yes stop_codon:yes gene_type:complete